MKKTKHRKDAKGALLKLRDKSQTDDEFRRNLCLVTGTSTKTGAELALNQMASIQVWNRYQKEPERALAAVDMIAEFAPKNALETLLAVQMFGVHEAALLFLQRATIPGQTFEGSGEGVLWATRLMRLFNEQVELMLKLKGKASEQKVTVEHVHVHQGGQAIVGTVGAPEAHRGEGVK